MKIKLKYKSKYLQKIWKKIKIFENYQNTNETKSKDKNNRLHF